jgi:hypothetical protein
MGHGLSSLRSAVRPYSPINRSIATGRLIDINSTLRIESANFVTVSRPFTSPIVEPLGTFNLFVGLTDVYNPTDYQIRSTTLSMPGGSRDRNA